ncbi:MAG: GTP 3',8-cyclase MoaA [Sedimentisphaerales bacterium]|nr:GTP 3',8-cyclase MoaA [Sedimentisphaerales bacterium]
MKVDYLRISVTDRCNLRCAYCNPLGDHGLKDDEEILAAEEIQRVVRLSVACGITKVRLTGGEPLVRADIVDLVQRLSGVEGIEDLVLTTNGVFLSGLAGALKQAGLKRVNISLDAADPECYRCMTGCEALSEVFDGIHRALNVGLTPVRINCVVVREINLSQVAALAEMALRLPVSVRFIEYCPTSEDTGPVGSYVPNREVREIVESRFGALSSVMAPEAGGPAVYFKTGGSLGTIGFISARSSIFCQRCNRLRLTSDGAIRPCLHSARSYDLKTPLRGGADDETIVRLLRRIVSEKALYTRLTAPAGDFSMQQIGG